MTTEKTIGIIIARMSSNRLHGKVLSPVKGKPLLSYTVERLKAVQGLDEIWLATTQHPSDEQLLMWGIEQDLHVLGYMGETDDVVGRITAVLDKSQAQRFVIVQGNMPFPDVRLMETFLQNLDEHPEWEGVRVDESDGASVHVGIQCFRTSGWRKIDMATRDAKHQENPCGILKLLDEQPNLVTMGHLQDDSHYYDVPVRLTVHTQSDVDMVEKILYALEKAGEVLSLKDIIHYLHENPILAEESNQVAKVSKSAQPLKILMAVQAGGHYGTGHLARCKTLARNLEEHFSAEVTFWLESQDGKFRRILNSEGYNVVEGNWSLVETIRQGDYSKVVIDFQTPVTPSLIQGVRMTAHDLPIIVMDNTGLSCSEADAIIFPNAHALPNPDWQLQNTKLYQGAPYVVPGAGFLFAKTEAIEASPLDQPCILVTMGGADPNLLSETILDSLKNLKDCHIDMVVPLTYPHPENLEKIATRMPCTVTLHWKITNLRPLMQRATVAVAAFGVTAYELAYLGVPSILLSHHENQVEDVQRFTQWGSAVSLGWGKALEPEQLYKTINALISDADRRREMSEKGKVLVDSKGPLRVAEAIISTVREPQPSLLRD